MHFVGCVLVLLLGNMNGIRFKLDTKLSKRANIPQCVSHDATDNSIMPGMAVRII